MAYIQNPEDELQKAQGGGQVLAGSGGAAPKAPTGTPGTGFTNLSKYLDANKGNSGAVVNQITEEANKGFTNDLAAADKTAADWGAGGVKQVQDAANPVIQGANADAAYWDGINNSNFNNVGVHTNSTAQYQGPNSAADVAGRDRVDAAYKKAEDGANAFKDYSKQYTTLKDRNQYSTGFAALDSVLGRQDGGAQINAGIDANIAGAKENGQYKGVNSAVGQIDSAVGKAQGDISSARAGAGSAKNSAQTRIGGYQQDVLDAAITKLETDGPTMPGISNGIIQPTTKIQGPGEKDEWGVIQ